VAACRLFEYDSSFGSLLLGQLRQNPCIVEEGEFAVDGLVGRKRANERGPVYRVDRKRMSISF
jgi:hypothetical protein